MKRFRLLPALGLALRLALMMGVHPAIAGAETGAGQSAPALAAKGPERSLPAVSLAPRGLWPADERAAAMIGQAGRKLAEARFNEALALTGRARELLTPYRQKQRALRYKARLEVTAATAFVALERRSDAIACFGRALAVAPDLELEPAHTSPKVLRVFREARSAR
jgi:hypothetical protein